MKPSVELENFRTLRGKLSFLHRSIVNAMIPNGTGGPLAEVEIERRNGMPSKII